MPPIQTIQLPGNSELLLTPSAELMKPVAVVNPNTALAAQGAIREAVLLEKIETPEQFKQGTNLQNRLGKLRKLIKDDALAKGRPYRDQAAEFSEKAKTYTDIIEQMEQAVGALLIDYRKREEAERQRKLEEARQLEAEARRRQEEAAAKVEAAKTEGEFKEAAKDFDDGLAAAELAKEQADLAPRLTTAKGVKAVRSVELLHVDKENIPRAFLVVDEAKLKKAILEDLVTKEHAWVQFRISETMKGTGR